MHASWSLGVPEELPPSETGTVRGHHAPGDQRVGHAGRWVNAAVAAWHDGLDGTGPPVYARHASKDSTPHHPIFPPHPPPQSATDCPLLQYAHKVSMEEVAAFDAWAPLAVQHALRTTVNNLVGNLPSSSFDVIIRTSAPKMALLLFSTLMTGGRWWGRRWGTCDCHESAGPVRRDLGCMSMLCPR